MLALGIVTLARFLRSREERSTINGWFATPHILSGSTGAISMWSPLLLSRPSSTSTNMCTRAMIIPPWSLAGVEMKSSNTWMHDILAAVKLYGMQRQVPNVVRLQVHLFKEQGVTFREDADGQDVIAQHADRATTLTGWFKANAAFPEDDSSCLLLYQDYPSKNV